MILRNNNETVYTKDGYTKLNGNIILDNQTQISNEFLNNIFRNPNNNSELKIKLLYSNNSFVLNIYNGNIIISGINDNEILLGIVNLISLKQSSDIVPNQIIIDKPKANHREFMLDIARNFFPLSEIKKIADEMFYNRINYLHLHFSDDQNYAIESRIHPELNTKEYLKFSEVGELINYCKERGIEVIPEFDIPGHLNHLLEINKDLRCNPIKGNSICFSKNHDYIYELIDEICSLFSSEYFHIGSDEIGIKNQCNCINCINLMKTKKLDNIKGLVSDFINDVSLYIMNKGKKVIAWNDSLKYGKINEEIIIQKWFNYPFDNSCLKEYKKGRKIIVSSATDLYFDIPYSLTPLKKTYNYIPEIDNNLIVNPFGISSHLWTEVLSKSGELEKNLFPRIEAFGENAWLEYNKLDYKDFLNRLKIELEQLKNRNIYFRNLKSVDEFSFKETLSFLKKKIKFKNYTDFSSLSLLKMMSEYYFDRSSNKKVKILKNIVRSI